MYDSHQSGVYSIAGDMCYDNKTMTSSATSIGPIGAGDATCLATAERPQTSPFDFRRKLLRPTLAAVVNVLVIVVVGVVLALIEFDVIPTNTLGYHCRDPALSHEFRGDTITATALIVGSFAGPLLVLVAVEYRPARARRSARLIWLWYKDMMVGVIATLMVTEVMKAIVGAPRPHFLATCSPDAEETCERGAFVREFRCRGAGYSAYVVGDSSRSFPSGHTSISVFVSLFCVALLHYRMRSGRAGQLLKPLLMLLFVSWGALCGLTRVTDRRHHWWDVLAGSALGAVGAAYTVMALVRRFEVRDGKKAVAGSRLLPPSSSHSRSTLLDEKRDRGGADVI